MEGKSQRIEHGQKEHIISNICINKKLKAQHIHKLASFLKRNEKNFKILNVFLTMKQISFSKLSNEKTLCNTNKK